MHVPPKLLALAAAVSWDGGDGVLRTLRQILREDAPFDAGEVALARSPGFQRWTLTDDDREVAGDDLLERAASADAPIRIDDASEAGFAPRTRQRMAERGLRSCLALPLGAGGGPEGAIVVAREHGWAFTAVSLHTLWPVASMAGLCLARSIALTALRHDADAARAGSRAEEEAVRRQLVAAESENHALRRAIADAEERGRAVAAGVSAIAAEADSLRSRAEGLSAELRKAQETAEQRTAELASAIQRIAELDRRLAEGDKDLVLAPASRRRRRDRAALELTGSAPATPGDEPGPSSES